MGRSAKMSDISDVNFRVVGNFIPDTPFLPVIPLEPLSPGRPIRDEKLCWFVKIKYFFLTFPRKKAINVCMWNCWLLSKI